MGNGASGEENRICDPGGSGIIVPLFGDGEGDWNESGRAVLYCLIMCYCFLGAAIVSDFFMSAIEAITSKKGRRVICDDKQHVITYYVWNDTIANLTLLALGSSAPEIIMSIVEVIKLEFKAGDLGPGVIVGSAAFNLLCIVSVAILAIPKGEVRYIKGVRVYHVTVVFSLLAYLWLLFIVQWSSKDVVEVWESVCTLLLFFLLVFLAFLVDKYDERKNEELEAALIQEEAAHEGEHNTMNKSLSDGSDHNIFKRAKKKVRKLLSPHMRAIKVHKEQLADRAQYRMDHENVKRLSHSGGGRPSCPVFPHVPSGMSDSIAAILIKSPPAGDNGSCILDNDGNPIINNHGVITFLCDQIEVKGCVHDTTLAIPVLRRNGIHGVISCKWRTERLDAVPNCDYQEDKGVLTFPEGVVCQEIILTILPQRQTENSESFQLVLDEPEGDPGFNPHDDGKENSAIMTILIVNNLEPGVRQTLCTKIYNFLVDPELITYGCELWKEQILDAFVATDEDRQPTLAESTMHYISLPWKVCCAVLAPPPVFCGGWILFFVALLLVGGLTAVTAEVAETFGCCMGWPNTVTAIVIVAPGTSLPDLFASQAAALGDENADASIVNVTGSNSVNVFLGLGLPWTMAAIYWQVKGEVGAPAPWLASNPNYLITYPDGAFIVPSGDLSFSVIIFTSCSFICLGLLRIKRHMDGGELGGNSQLKNVLAGFFCSMYVWYIVMNIWKASSDEAFVSHYVSIAGAGIFTIFVIVCECAFASGKLHSNCPDAQKTSDAGAAKDQIPLVLARSKSDDIQAETIEKPTDLVSSSKGSVKTISSPSPSVDTIDSNDPGKELELTGKVVGKSEGDSLNDGQSPRFPGDASSKALAKKKKKSASDCLSPTQDSMRSQTWSKGQGKENTRKTGGVKDTGVKDAGVLGTGVKKGLGSASSALADSKDRAIAAGDELLKAAKENRDTAVSKAKDLKGVAGKSKTRSLVSEKTVDKQAS